MNKNNNNYGWDGGFGYIKSAYYENNEVELLKYPSVVAEAKGKESSTYELDDGKHYFVGAKALKQPKDTIIEIVDYQKLEKFSPILFLESLKLSGKNPDEIGKVVSGLSISHKDSTANFKSRLSNFVVDGKEYNFEIELLPQGVGAVNAIKELVKREPNDYLVVDGGFNTIDVVTVIDKDILNSELNGYDNKGVINIAEMLQKYIKTNFEREISLKNALSVLDSGIYTLRGKKNDITPIIEEFKKEYTIEVMDFLEKNYSERFDNMEKIIFVGGGAYFIDEEYSENIAKVPNPEYYNALGNLLSAE